MRAIKTSIFLAAIFGCAVSHATVTTAAPAEEVDTGAAKLKNSNGTNPPPITVAVKFEGGPGQISTSRAYITAGTNKFAFLVPDEFKLTSSDAQRATLMKPDGSAVITVRVISSLAGSGKEFDGSAARALIYEEHPDATVTTEFGIMAANASGPAFEFFWGAGSVARASRVGFVPLRAGVIEFSLDASPKNLAPALGDFNYLLVTFRASDENGKLEATPLSDRL